MTIERLTYRSKQTSEAVQFLGGRAQATEMIEWANSLGATGTYLSGSSGTGSAAVPAREQRLRVGQTNPNAPTPAERSKSIIMDLIPGDWLVAVGRRLYRVDGAEFGALWERVDDGTDGVVEYLTGSAAVADGGDEGVPDGNDEEGGDDPQDAPEDDTVDEVDDPEDQEHDGEDQEEEAHVGLMPPVPVIQTEPDPTNEFIATELGLVPEVPLTEEQEEAMEAGNNLIGNPFPEIHDEGSH